MVQEKRGYPRKSQLDPIHVDILEMSDQNLKSVIRFDGAMKDISQSGLRLHGKHPLAQGATLGLTLEIEASQLKYNLTGKVKWVSKTTEDEYVAGVEIESNSQDYSNWQHSFN